MCILSLLSLLFYCLYCLCYLHCLYGLDDLCRYWLHYPYCLYCVYAFTVSVLFIVSVLLILPTIFNAPFLLHRHSLLRADSRPIVLPCSTVVVNGSKVPLPVDASSLDRTSKIKGWSDKKDFNDVHSQASHMPLPKAIARCTSEPWLPLTLCQPVGNIKVATSLHTPPFQPYLQKAKPSD